MGGIVSKKKTAPTALVAVRAFSTKKDRNKTIVLKESPAEHSIINEEKKQRNQPTVMLKVAENKKKTITGSQKERSDPTAVIEVAVAADEESSKIPSKPAYGSRSRTNSNGSLRENNNFKLNPAVQHDAEKHAEHIDRMLSRRNRMRSIEPTRCVEPGSDHRFGQDHFKRVLKSCQGSRAFIRNMSEKLHLEDDVRTLSMSPHRKDPNFFSLNVNSAVENKVTTKASVPSGEGLLPGLEQLHKQYETTISSMLRKHYLFSPLKKVQLDKLSLATMVVKVKLGIDLLRQGYGKNLHTESTDKGESSLYWQKPVFWGILEGEVQVSRDNHPPRTLSAGQSFGEIALLYHSAARVTATTTTDCTLFCLSLEMYKSVLLSARESKSKVAMACLAQVKQLNCLSSDQLHEIEGLVDQVEVPVGEVLFSRGSLISAADPYFYMVEEGEVTLTHPHPLKPQVIRAGGHFGSQALGLNDLHTVSHQHQTGWVEEHKHRTATATAAKSNSFFVKLLRLHKDDVDIKMGPLRELARCNLIMERFASIGFLHHLPKAHLQSMAEHTHTYDIGAGYALELQPDHDESNSLHCRPSDFLLIVVEGALVWKNPNWQQCMSHCFMGESFEPLPDNSGVLLGPGCLFGQLSCQIIRTAQAVQSQAQLNHIKLVGASSTQIQSMLKTLLINKVQAKSGVPFPSLDDVEEDCKISVSHGLSAIMNPLSACEEEGGAVVLALHSRWFLKESKPARKRSLKRAGSIGSIAVLKMASEHKSTNFSPLERAQSLVTRFKAHKKKHGKRRGSHKHRRRSHRHGHRRHRRSHKALKSSTKNASNKSGEGSTTNEKARAQKIASNEDNANTAASVAENDDDGTHSHKAKQEIRESKDSSSQVQNDAHATPASVSGGNDAAKSSASSHHHSHRRDSHRRADRHRKRIILRKDADKPKTTQDTVNTKATQEDHAKTRAERRRRRKSKRPSQKNANAKSASVLDAGETNKASASSDSDDDGRAHRHRKRRTSRKDADNQKPTQDTDDTKPTQEDHAKTRAERRRRRKSKRQSRKNANAKSASAPGTGETNKASASSDSNDDRPHRHRKRITLRKDADKPTATQETDNQKLTQEDHAKTRAERRRQPESKRQSQKNANAKSASASVSGSDHADKDLASSDSDDDDKPQSQQNTDARDADGANTSSPSKLETTPTDDFAAKINTSAASSPDHFQITRLDNFTSSPVTSDDNSSKVEEPDRSHTHVTAGDEPSELTFDQTLDAGLMDTANAALDNTGTFEFGEWIKRSVPGNNGVDDSKQLPDGAIAAIASDPDLHSRSIFLSDVGTGGIKKDTNKKIDKELAIAKEKKLKIQRGISQYSFPLNAEGGLDCTLDDLEKGLIIGQGAFGCVFMCKLRFYSTPAGDEEEVFALKKMSKNKIIKESNPEAVLRETEVLRLVRGSIFCPYLFAALQDDNHLYLLQEFLQGGDLYFLMKNSGMFEYSMLPVYIAQTYSACLICALAFLHEQGVVFRDLKPENVMLTATGHIKLVDFGIAKRIGKKHTTTIVGTPEYIAPEALLGSGYGFSVDVWSLAIVLFEMLCGFTPFADSADMDETFIYERILHEDMSIHIECVEGDEELDLMTQLFQRDVHKRIGCSREGLMAFKSHPFYEDTDWAKIAAGEFETPLIPVTKTHRALANFPTASLTEANAHDKYEPTGAEFESHWDKCFVQC